MENRIPVLEKKKRSSFNRFIRTVISQHAVLGNVSRRIFGVYKYSKWRARCWLRKRKNHFNFDTIYFASPDEILMCTELEYDPIVHDGMLLDGDWDISNKRFDQLDVFKAMNDHFNRGIAWEETPYYTNLLDEIKAGYTPSRCSNEQELKQRFKRLETLYAHIQKFGYKQQTELPLRPYDLRRIDEISVNLDRNGNLLFNNSVHRLAIAKLLGIRTVPVRVTVCHANCSDFTKLNYQSP